MPPKIKTFDYKSDNAGTQFVESLYNTGFAVMHNHPLDFNLITSVYDEWGNQWIDFTSTIFVTNAGHGNPRIVQALKKVLEKICTIGWLLLFLIFPL